jgi:hypothetical protein
MGSLTAIAGARLYLDANTIIYAAEGSQLLPASLREALARVDRCAIGT